MTYYPECRAINSTNLDDYLAHNVLLCHCGATFRPICLTASGTNVVTCKSTDRHQSALYFNDGQEGIIRAEPL